VAEVMANESFEGGSSGAGITSSNTNFNTVTAGTPTFDNSTFNSGAQSMLINPTAASEYTGWDYGTATDIGSVRFYFRISSLPAAITYLVNILSGATVRAQLGLNTDGTIRLRNSTTLVATTTGTITLGAWMRFEYQLSGNITGASTQATRIFSGNSTSPVAGMDISGVFNTGTFNHLFIGSPASATIVCNFDDIRITDQAEFQGPIPAVSNWTYGYDVVIG
jgi:hypothetical protein